MFFLLRCIFWLGLVFSHLPWDGEALRQELSGPAASVGAAAADKVQSLCLKDPAACAKHAHEVGRALGVGASQNSLLPGDLAPVWKGGAKPASRHAPS